MIQAYGALAALAVLVAAATVLMRARRAGIPVEQMLRFWLWAYFGALAGALLPAFLAHSSQISLSSLGATLGGLLVALLWCGLHRLSPLETLRRLDIAAFAMPMAWMIGRLGCAFAHDHRGPPSTSWIAVKFPEGPRYDLGLIEFLFMAGVTALFLILDRRPRPVGFYLALCAVLYGGFRIWLNTLHFQPMNFYGGIAGVLLGLLAWTGMRNLNR